jgi:hypothetical protein
MAGPPVGTSTAIVDVLHKYKEVPEEFLAKILGRLIVDIEGDLETLRAKGVITRQDNKVRLA